MTDNDNEKKPNVLQHSIESLLTLIENRKDQKGKSTLLTVSIPFDQIKVNVENLMTFLEAKGMLIKKALDLDTMMIEVKEDAIDFLFFTKPLDVDEMKAYALFFAALCKMSKGQKCVTVSGKETENEKYAFRCFLLQLGFVGEKYSAERKILLRNFFK